MFNSPLLKSVIKIFLLFIFVPVIIFGQEKEIPEKSRTSFRKTNSFADEAVGIQTKGQLQNITMNYGQISDTRYEDVGNAPTESFFNFRYPRENFTGLVDDFSLFFAIPQNSKNGNKGNVVDAWTDNDNEDFIAKDGAYGNTHYNPANDPNAHEEILYNGQTPYLATSDLKLTWPVNANGNAFWPGIFRRDPETGLQIENEFASDRDIYCEFNDNNNQDGDVIGIEVHEMAYSYGRVYAENALFYEFWIINKSGRQLDSCYTGLYQDPDCSDHGEEALLWKDSTYEDGSRLWSIAQRDFDGDIGGATRPNRVGITEDYTFGTVILETPDNIGITDFHYFADPGPSDDHRLWPIITSDKTNPTIAGEVLNYFHGTNDHIDDVSLITDKQDLAWLMGTGPFSMAPGDTVKLTCAVVVGDDDAHYYHNVNEAKKLFDAKFNGPIAPPSPKLTAVPGDKKVTLYWDASPEKFIDPSTGEQDFEGYKIYRSEDGGTTWGTKITDAQGRTYGYVPIAQFDLKNNIKGTDPKNSLIWLGDDSGIQHSWVDENVINGIDYSYTIISYDQGTSTLFSLEGARGDGPQVDNFVNVTPSPNPLGYIPAEVNSITHTGGTGEGNFDIEIVDSEMLTDFTYQLIVEGSPAETYSLTRGDQNNSLLYASVPINADSQPIVDGFSVSLSSDNKIGGLKLIEDGEGNNVEGVNNVSSDSSWFVSASPFPNADLESQTASYSIVFSEENSVAYSWGINGSVAQYTVPFSVFNKLTDKKVCFEIRDLNGNDQWDEGETIFITRVEYPEPAPAMGDGNPATAVGEFAYQVIINNAPTDSLNLPPVTGTVINIISYNALKDGDTFELTFNKSKTEAANVDLSQIRVVPNPYIVVSKFENLQNVRDIKFMYLPPECSIKIYTVAGTLVKTIEHNSGEGTLSWNLLSDWNQALAYGVYVYVVEDPFGNKHIDKFALIK